MKYLKKFENHASYEEARQNLILPNVSLCKQENEVHYNPLPYDYSKDYLTFVALEDGTFKFTNNGISYSLDNGETWTELATNTASPTVTAGNKIMWKRLVSYGGSGTFKATGNFEVQGNIMSLVYGDDFNGQTDLTEKSNTFNSLFLQNTKLINAKNLILPATTLVSDCYYQMFYGCTSLATAPELPATTLASYCYQYMFTYCSSLTTAPELPATTLVSDCYRSMFRDCTSLNYIKAMFTTTPSSSYTSSWVSGVASSGTFVKNSAATWTTTGVNGIPSGWTVETASE